MDSILTCVYSFEFDSSLLKWQVNSTSHCHSLLIERDDTEVSNCGSCWKIILGTGHSLLSCIKSLARNLKYDWSKNGPLLSYLLNVSLCQNLLNLEKF